MVLSGFEFHRRIAPDFSLVKKEFTLLLSPPALAGVERRK